MNVKKIVYPTRYFIGIEHDHPLPMSHKEDSHVAPLFRRLQAWEEDIDHVKIPKQFVGLACYPPKVLELDTFDYFALLEVHELQDTTAPLVQKKLPNGTYLEIETTFDELRTTIEEMYRYIEENKLNIHEGFDAIMFHDPSDQLLFSVMLKDSNHE
ncbi:MAG: GyrI-like domain-containing protein [Candidatus Izemoplasmataceae bacterium]